MYIFPARPAGRVWCGVGAVEDADEDVGAFVGEDVSETLTEPPFGRVSGAWVFGPDEAFLATG